MRVTIWKNEKESNERCITRFNKKVQGSRKLLLLKSRRYFTKSATRRYTRASAIMRSMYRGIREKNRFY